MCVCVWKLNNDKRQCYSSTTACVFSLLSLTFVRGTISAIAIVLVERREGGGGGEKEG